LCLRFSSSFSASFSAADLTNPAACCLNALILSGFSLMKSVASAAIFPKKFMLIGVVVVVVVVVVVAVAVAICLAVVVDEEECEDICVAH